MSCVFLVPKTFDSWPENVISGLFSVNFRWSLLSFFRAIVLISAVISILEDFGSLLPARSVTVKDKQRIIATMNKFLHKIFPKKVFFGNKFEINHCIIFNINIRSKPINVGLILVLKPFTRYWMYISTKVQSEHIFCNLWL